MDNSLSDFDFEFPEASIALTPKPRGQSKMMTVPWRGEGKPDHRITSDLVSILRPGDALVLNETKVIPARLKGTIETGAAVEVLLLSPLKKARNEQTWEVMYRSSNPCRPGTKVYFSKEFAGCFEVPQNHLRVMSFAFSEEEFDKQLEDRGEMPLPPYIHRSAQPEDRENYQSVFAREKGSVAAPTASLHISEAMLTQLLEKGVHIVKVLLHVGYGTFSPVKTENLSEHQMHKEWYSISTEACSILNRVRGQGGRVVAVGTTVSRVLETAGANGVLVPGQGWTNIFIYPGYKWNVTDGLLTNFHWPKSTLFMLVCSILGIERAKSLYKLAIEHNYRLFSYGDSLLIF